MAKRKPISIVAAERAGKESADKARNLMGLIARLNVLPTLEECQLMADALPELRRALREAEQEVTWCRERGHQPTAEMFAALQSAHDAVTLAERAGRLVGEAARK